MSKQPTKTALRAFARREVKEADMRGYRFSVQRADDEDDAEDRDGNLDFEDWSDAMDTIAPGEFWIVTAQVVSGRSLEGCPMGRTSFRLPGKLERTTHGMIEGER